MNGKIRATSDIQSDMSLSAQDDCCHGRQIECLRDDLRLLKTDKGNSCTRRIETALRKVAFVTGNTSWQLYSAVSCDKPLITLTFPLFISLTCSQTLHRIVSWSKKNQPTTNAEGCSKTSAGAESGLRRAVVFAACLGKKTPPKLSPGREQLKLDLHIDSLVNFAFACLCQLLRKIQFLLSVSLTPPFYAAQVVRSPPPTFLTNKCRSPALSVGGTLRPP